MWDLPGPGLEPVSPAMAGGFLTTAPPGKPWSLLSLDALFPSRASLSIHLPVVNLWSFAASVPGLTPPSVARLISTAPLLTPTPPHPAAEGPGLGYTLPR